MSKPHTEEFWTRYKNGPGGLHSWCRECKNLYEFQRYLLKPPPKRLYPDRNGKLRSPGVVSNQRRRFAVLCHYGGDPPACACCGEQVYEFLGIDHIDGGGGKHRKLIKQRMYGWLIDQGFPQGYRVLCHNCNLAYGLYGYCPHQQTDA